MGLTLTGPWKLGGPGDPISILCIAGLLIIPYLVGGGEGATFNSIKTKLLTINTTR